MVSEVIESIFMGFIRVVDFFIFFFDTLIGSEKSEIVIVGRIVEEFNVEESVVFIGYVVFVYR